MAAMLALGAAMTWGVADFLGGMTSRRTDELTVATLSQVAGLAVLAALLPLTGGAPSAAALAWGAVAGLGGAGGLVGYFRALSIGPMGVTAPLAALTGALVPIGVGLALGERPGAMALVGICLGLGAVVIASRPGPAAATHTGPDDRAATHDSSRRRRGIGTAALAGLLFGLFFVALDQAPVDAGMWPLLGARIAGVGLLALLVTHRAPVRPEGRAAAVAFGSGVLDMGANALFLLAVQQGLLVLVSVLTSLYPVGIVLLARIVLGERLGRAQLAGVGLALAAVVLIAA